MPCSSFSDCIIQADEYAFYSGENLINVSINENLESDNIITIDDRAFQHCKRLENVTMGMTVLR